MGVSSHPVRVIRCLFIVGVYLLACRVPVVTIPAMSVLFLPLPGWGVMTSCRLATIVFLGAGFGCRANAVLVVFLVSVVRGNSGWVLEKEGIG